MLFSELAKRVAEKYPEVKTAFPMDCELSNVELYDPNGAIPPVDTLGIYTARQISEDMTLPLCFVCAGTPDQTAHDKIAYSDSNYIIIPQVSAVDVVYYIMSLFGDSFKQQKLYSNLIYMLLNDADLTSVFCEFSKGTGSQMLAIDISGKVLAYSKPFRVNHPHWIHSIEVGYLDNYLIEYILSYRVKHKMDMSPNTFVLFCNRLQMYIKVIRVIADNEIIGYVFMGNYTGEFPWFSDKLMHLLAKNLHSTLLGSRSYSTYRFNMHQSVLSDIIEGASEDETIQRINAAKLTFPPNMRAVVLKPSYFRGNEYLYDVLTPRVAEILPASPRVYKKNAIVTFVGVDNAGALPEETRTAIETLAADGQILVGVSNLFHKPSKLYVYYQQALQAMSFSRRLSNTGGVFFFSDYAFYIMLDRMEDTPLLEQCRHPVLASLEAYDADKNTELYETLKIYTKTGFSKNRTAELMLKHLNLDFPITVVGYTLNTMVACQNRSNISLICGGGFYHRNTELFDSPEGVALISRLNINKCFMAAAGVTSKGNLSCIEPYEFMYKKAAINSSSTRILLVDSSKFGKMRPCMFSNLSDFDMVITDSDIGGNWISLFEQSNLKYIIV